ncbi:DUF6221 family protein [Streptomyces asiaticus]
MTDIADFLRARYQEQREAQGRIFRDTYQPGNACPLCQKPTWEMTVYGGDPSRLASFDPCGHEINDPAQLDQFQEPAPDPDVIADLDAKLALVDELDAADPEAGYITATFTAQDALRLLAQPFAGHPDHKGEEWAS